MNYLFRVDDSFCLILQSLDAIGFTDKVYLTKLSTVGGLYFNYKI